MKKESVNPVEALLDPNNHDNIVLYDDNDKPFEFEQIAIIPIEERTYAILTPVEGVPGIEEDDAFVFEIIENKEDYFLQLVENNDLINDVFDRYNNLLEEAKGN